MPKRPVNTCLSSAAERLFKQCLHDFELCLQDFEQCLRDFEQCLQDYLNNVCTLEKSSLPLSCWTSSW